MIRGQKRIIKNKREMNFDVNAQIHNKFDIEVIDAKTGKVKQEAKAFNIVCNNLWTRLFAMSNYFNYIFYGSGTGTPSVEDTDLFEKIGYGTIAAADDVYNIDYKQGVFSYRRKIQLSETVAVGKTITEVGIGYSTSAGTLCTHAMLQDMNGNAISIEKTDTDIINIYATVYVHFNAKGFDGGSIRMNYYDYQYSLLTLFAGVSITQKPNKFVFSNCFAFKRLNGGTYETYIGSFDAKDGNGSPRSTITYSNNPEQKTITLTAARLSANNGNIGGIVRIFLAYHRDDKATFSNYYSYPSVEMFVGGSWFPYSEIIGEAVGTGDGVTVDFGLDFPFAHDAKIYVDGILRNDVVVDYSNNNAGTYQYLQHLDKDASEDNLIPNYEPAAYDGQMYIKYGGHIFYNPMHKKGIASMYLSNTILYASNNLKEWVEIVNTVGKAAAKFEIPEEYANYKYWKFSYEPTTNSVSAKFYSIVIKDNTSNVIHFATPPAEGAIITADYRSDCIAKDVNHVFDFALTFHFGEYTG